LFLLRPVPLRIETRNELTERTLPEGVAAQANAMVGPGLYQVNVVVPTVDPKYRFFSVPVVISVSGAATQASGFIMYDWFAIP
jgi:hypothetical protein